MRIDEHSLSNVLDTLFKRFYFFDVISDFDYKSVLNIFQFDYNRYFSDAYIDSGHFFSRIELVGILCYRIARWLYENMNESNACHYSNLGRLISGFEIYYSADIGKGMKINHGLGTVIGARCIIGEHVLLHQNVTLGDRNGGRPVLLDNVTVYAGAKVLGNVKLGNNSVIGANSGCLTDVPDNGILIGIPGKVK